MVTKTLKILSCLSLLLLLNNCFGGEDCNSGLGDIEVNDMLKVTPFSQNYAQGDTITFKLDVPSQNEFFGYDTDIYTRINKNYGKILISNFKSFSDGNEVIPVKATQITENQFNFPYNATSNSYELELKVVLNRLGLYSFYTSNTITFQGSSKCDFFHIRTNIEGHTGPSKLEFTVQ